MGRLEAYAMGNKAWPSILDAIGNSMGYAWILLLVAFIREIFGAGKLTLPGGIELTIIPQAFYDMGYMNNNLVILPPMALIVVGLIIWAQRARNPKLIEDN
jgi:Na+-transporting NADH:ubiquinone oxidoreductase subunit D